MHLDTALGEVSETKVRLLTGGTAAGRVGWEITSEIRDGLGLAVEEVCGILRGRAAHRATHRATTVFDADLTGGSLERHRLERDE